MTSALTIGVDLSTEPVRTGLCVVEWGAERASVAELVMGVDDEVILDRAKLPQVVVGLDSPIGWPDAFVDFVREQQAGTLVSRTLEQQRAWRRTLAYRLTDEVVREVVGLVPLSVSTDRLGLVAMRAVSLMAGMLGPNVALDRSGVAPVLEVYPAATLRMWQLPSRGYKASADVRRTVLTEVQARAPWLDLNGCTQLALEVDHAFDALLAALTVRAWQRGAYLAATDEQRDRARREGWIIVPTGRLEDLLG